MNDPKVNEALSRNIAGPGEMPLHGDEDSDMFRQLLKSKPMTPAQKFRMAQKK
jgi:hypothetical protein